MDRYIKESELREVIDKWQENLAPRFDLKDSVIFDTLESVNFHIDDLATVDVVEVVRCKDCVLHNKCTTEDVFNMAGKTDGFCCVGKKVE